MRLRRLAVLLLLSGAGFTACRMSAQEPLRMTIDELFRRVEQANVDVKAAQKRCKHFQRTRKNSKGKAVA